MKSLNEITSSQLVKENSDADLEKLIMDSNGSQDEQQCDVDSILSGICDTLGLSDDLFSTLSKVQSIDEESASLVSDAILKMKEAFDMIDSKYGIVESKSKNSSTVDDVKHIFLEDIISEA